MAQPREPADSLGQDQRRAVAILDVGSTDHSMEQITVGVGQEDAVVPLDLLPCVTAARPAAIRRIHAPAVDHSGAGRRLATYSFPADQQPGMIERERQAGVVPDKTSALPSKRAESRTAASAT